MCRWEDMCHPKGAEGLGLRHAKTSNLAFMSKLGWGLIYNRDDLWVKVLRGKYSCGSNLIHVVSMKHGCSNLWSRICEAWHHIEENLM